MWHFKGWRIQQYVICRLEISIQPLAPQPLALQFLALRHLAIGALVVGVLSAAALFGEFDAVSSDAGQHYALVRALMDLDGWRGPALTPNLGALPHYPPVAHWMAAGIGKLLNSGLLGMMAVADAAVGLFYLAMFALTSRINWRVPLVACLITIVYALCRGPVFGRQIVNNFFFAQVVGSTIAAWALLIVLLKFHKWKGIVLDGFVLAIGQIVVATHLTPAAQLLAAYCTVLLVQAWARSSWNIFGRLVFFAATSLVLTFLNPFARELISVAQQGGGAHINHLLGHRLVQLSLLILAGFSSARLILKSYRTEDAGLFLGCMCLAACGLAFVQMALLGVGIGSEYAIMKHLFVIVALFIFVLAANQSFKADTIAGIRVPGPWAQLALCSVLALLAMRVDLLPSIVKLNRAVVFQRAVRELGGSIERPDGRLPIVLASVWPPNISYAIMIGDLRVPMGTADQVLLGGPIDTGLVAVVLMPSDDPLVVPDCAVARYSNRLVTALDYSCFLRNSKMKIPKLAAGDPVRVLR
jgi:hypothetical protein